MLYPFTLLVWPLLALRLAQCSPLRPSSKRQIDVNCNDPAAVFVDTCWITLGVSDYLNDPTTGWNHTTPVCSDSTKCCLQGEAWSTCYLRLGRGLGGADCTTVDDQTCTWDNAISPYLDPSIAPQVRYVIKSIYGIHDFFSSYYKALQYATTQASLMITPITNTIDPNKQTQLAASIVLFALGIGFAFTTAPTMAEALLKWTSAAKHSAQTFAIGLQQAPAVGRAMWPAGDEASKTFQIAQLDTELSVASKNISSMLDRGLELLMTDVPTFVSFAQRGDYCGNGTVDINEKLDHLDVALRTYITSESLKQNGWYARPLGISTEEEYQSMLTTQSPAEKSCNGWTLHGCTVDFKELKNRIWWSSSTGRQYSLEHKGDQTILPSALLPMLTSQEWANMFLLFDGAYDCVAEGRVDSQDLIRIKYDGTLDTSCISRLPMLRQCGSLCPQLLGDGSCPFGFSESCDTTSPDGGVRTWGPANSGILTTDNSTDPAIQQAGEQQPSASIPAPAPTHTGIKTYGPKPGWTLHQR